MYLIYAAISPSGRMYIGLTKNLKQRWVAHVRKARENKGRHPFYDAMRKHGTGAFTLRVLSKHETLEAAKAEEVAAIKRCRPLAYNVSDGGEYDAGSGGKAFWSRLREDPEALAAYLSRLSQAIRESPLCGGNPTHLAELFAAKSPREKWKFQQRATRMARGRPGPPITYGAGPDTSVTKSKQIRHARGSRENAKALWARRTEDEKKKVAGAIAETLRGVYAEGSEARRRLAEVARKGRENMDRKKQGQAASKGLKAFWERLRKDPEAYARYIEARRKTLLETLSK